MSDDDAHTNEPDDETLKISRPTRISIKLDQATPSTMNAQDLRDQLHHIGLKCDDTMVPRLEAYIKEVRDKIPSGGKLEGYAIRKPSTSDYGKVSHDEALAAALEAGYDGTTVEAATANWTIREWGHAQHLDFIAYPPHFAWLHETTPDRYHRSVLPKRSGRDASVDAIKNQFAAVGTDATQYDPRGLSKELVEATLTKCVALTDNVKDYDGSDYRVLHIVDNYDPAADDVDAIGFLVVSWRLTISEYKEKRKSDPKHDWGLTVTTTTAKFDDIKVLEADFDRVKRHFSHKEGPER